MPEHETATTKPLRPLRKKQKEVISQSNLKAIAFTTADEYSLENIERYLVPRGYVKIDLDDDVDDALCFMARNSDTSSGHVFVFESGSVVFWNVEEEKRNEVLATLKKYETNPYDESIVEEETETMDYRYDPEAKTKILKDLIVLNSSLQAKRPTHLDQYAFSNAIALSVKLAAWEASLDTFSQTVQNLAQDMKSGKKLSLNRAQIFQKTGVNYSV